MAPTVRHRRPLRTALIACAVAAVLVVAGSRALPHLFPQFLRPMWSSLGAPLERDVPSAISDLPAVYYDGKDPNGPVAILLSGNGGWWGLCDQLATRLEREHITTIGLNSLAYFVGRRTPAGIADDIARMMTTVAPQRPVMLLGYSYGADVVATIFNDLDPAVRARIRFVSLMGLTRDVTYGIGFWHVAAETRRTASAVATISGPFIQCFAGTEEGRKSACHALDPHKVEIIELPGGHHFGGDYKTLAQHIIDGWKRRAARQNLPAPARG